MFHPTVDNITVFPDYDQLSVSGAFARAPLVAGHAHHGDGWYRSVRSCCKREENADIDRLADYAAKLSFTDAQWNLFRERAFNCPTAYTIKSREKYGVPTWRYSYHGDWDNLRLYNGSAGLGPDGSGAYHGSDLNMIFGTAEDVSELRNTRAEGATSKYMMSAWAAFARDSKFYGWPGYSSNGKLDN